MDKAHDGEPEVAERSHGPTASKEQRPQSYNHRKLNAISNTLSLKHDPELQKENA